MAQDITAVRDALQAIQILAPLIDREIPALPGVFKWTDAVVWQTVEGRRALVEQAILALKNNLNDAIAYAAGVVAGGGGMGVPLQSFTSPAGSALTQANFEITLLTALNQGRNSSSFPTGVTIQIPPGIWNMLATTLYINGIPSRPITLAGSGAGNTIIQWPGDMALPAVWFDGYPYSVSPGGSGGCVGGGIRDMTLRCNPVGNTATGTGVFIDTSLFLNFENIEIEGFPGTNGRGIHVNSTDVSQNLCFKNIRITTCNTAVRLRNVNTTRFYKLDITNSQTRDLEIAGRCDFTIFGGIWQSGTVSPCVRATGGANNVQMYSIYHEGAANLFFQATQPSEGWSEFRLQDVQMNNCVNGCDVTGIDVLRLSFAEVSMPTTRLLTAVGTKLIEISGAADPETAPSKYSLDDYSRYRLHCTSTVNSAGNDSLGKPYYGQLPRVQSVTGMLRPYAKEIWDFNIPATITLVSGAIDVVRGIVNGATLTAPTAGKRPVYSASNGNFGWQGTMGATSASQNVVFGTLSSSFVSGDNLGIFVVMRTTAQSSNIGGPAVSATGGANPLYTIGGRDSVTGVSDLLYFRAQLSGASQVNVAGAGTVAHALLYQSPARGYDTGTQAQVTGDCLFADNGTENVYGGPTQNPQNSSLVTTVSLPGGLSSANGNVEIAYVAVLRRTLSPGEINTLMELAKERWGIG